MAFNSALTEIDSNVLVETEHLGSNNAIIVTRDGVVLVDSPHRPTDAMRWRRIVESCGKVAYLMKSMSWYESKIGRSIHEKPGWNPVHQTMFFTSRTRPSSSTGRPSRTAVTRGPR